MPLQRKVFPDIESLSQGFADFAATALQNTLNRKPQATLVVPGGSTPRHYLPALAKCKLPWDRITVTLSDERWVNVNDDQSNEKLIKQHLLSHLPANTPFVGLKTSHDNPFDAIEALHQRLDSLPLPVSLTVLGLGEDGHIASLFPGMNPDSLSAHHCVAVAPPIAPSLRVSLSLEMLANSEQIVLVVTGEGKRRLLDRLTTNPDTKIPFIWLSQLTNSEIIVFETNEK
ncbi:6-phosphogluconolactonase [Nitrosomonas oligotropha]|uniref:6-phosphogluconolactonase n=1 Tax=Nitrosomonas oligotropha TaxID=42354 RepID=A0A1H8L5C5_9PROT|nr:6-phosphogluconolactonase [Nitrosomonas oligotropha]SDW18906.1 6-phosphogluconolactonase [Nitrosomonas oligotropha]SEO00289.1 6-phosphogluconolactonase [Nitrosomonas oligotropha]